MLGCHCLTVFAFCLFLLTFSNVVGGRFVKSRGKDRPFECGFDPKDSARLPFSIRFFLLAVVFLIFDIEVALLFPVVLSASIGIVRSVLVASVTFLLVLIVGLLYE